MKADYIFKFLVFSLMLTGAVSSQATRSRASVMMNLSILLQPSTKIR